MPSAGRKRSAGFTHMALQGTLRDFGISDIFQLIGHQSKTGLLHLRNRDQEVKISFFNGDVVHAENSARHRRELLGALLVQAELITPQQLEVGLEMQRKTLRRLGDILVEQAFFSQAVLKEFTHLQITETLYRLFTWTDGTYDFEVQDVDFDKETVDPIRSESILMEGFRILDEWPMVRNRIPSNDMTFQKLRDAPKNGAKEKDIGPAEIKVLGLVRADRDVQKLIDISRLGEFETCKAVANLMGAGFIKFAAYRRELDGTKAAVPLFGATSSRLGRILVQISMSLFLLALGWLLSKVIDIDWWLRHESGTQAFEDPAARELFSALQQERIRSALQVFRLETGSYPTSLEELVRAELLEENDLHWPWKKPHVYELRDDSYRLLRPFE